LVVYEQLKIEWPEEVPVEKLGERTEVTYEQYKLF